MISCFLRRAVNIAGIVRCAIHLRRAYLGGLDCGAAGVLVPHIDTAAKAEEIVAACRYRTVHRGFSTTTRAGGDGSLFYDEHMSMQDSEVACIAMIEDINALNEIDQIVHTLSLVSFTNFIPTLIIGPSFGVLVDRVRVHIAAVVTQSLMLIFTALLLVCIYLDILGQAGLTILSLLLGIVASAHHPIRMLLAPQLVNKATIGTAISTVAILFNLARMTGPALGGWLIVK